MACGAYNIGILDVIYSLFCRCHFFQIFTPSIIHAPRAPLQKILDTPLLLINITVSFDFVI